MLLAAFLLGLLGSFHCVGMCGPLALAVPVRTDTWMGRWAGAWLYNLGRTTSYALLGAILGAVGMSMALAGLQQVLSIVLGTALLVGLLVPGDWLQGGRLAFWSGRVKKSLGQLLRDPAPGKQFSIGFLNGLLPCGLVYMGIAGALAQGSVWQGGFFMAAFGLGTLPAMLATMLVGNWVGPALRNRIRQMVPLAVGAMALLLILRGMNLGIPYLSPQIEKMTKVSSSADRCH